VQSRRRSRPLLRDCWGPWTLSYLHIAERRDDYISLKGVVVVTSAEDDWPPWRIKVNRNAARQTLPEGDERLLCGGGCWDLGPEIEGPEIEGSEIDDMPEGDQHGLLLRVQGPRGATVPARFKV
jgi:hypothetical protein